MKIIKAKLDDLLEVARLFDLYLETPYRKTGIGESLMNRATQWSKDNRADRLDLMTEKTNAAGQSLYEKLGYKKAYQQYYAYSLDLL